MGLLFNKMREFSTTADAPQRIQRLSKAVDSVGKVRWLCNFRRAKAFDLDTCTYEGGSVPDLHKDCCCTHITGPELNDPLLCGCF